MSPLPERGHEKTRDERAISSLSARTGTSLAEVRVLFGREFARLALGATVRSYLAVLATANVFAMLRRKGKSPARAQERRSMSLATLRGSVPEDR